MSAKRMLCCMSSMNMGGAETFLMKQYRQLDRSKYQLDFCVNVQKKCAYDDEIEALGGRIFRIPPKSKNFIGSLTELKKIVKDNGYETVFSSSAKAGVAIDLLAARAGGAKRLIHRSSSAGHKGGTVEKITHATLGKLAHIVPDIKLAPSILAAEFCFGKDCVKKGKAHILNNGVDTDIFSFSEQVRDETRRSLGLNDEFTLIHIGRFVEVKNHSFLIDVFDEVVRFHNNSKLILVGEGDLQKKISARAQEKGLGDKVLFLGPRTDIAQLLSAADVLVFPSFYEGMPNVVIESQAMGLKCVISDKITEECKITSLVTQLELGDSSLWSKEILKSLDSYERVNMTALLKEKRYDARSTVEDFIKYCFDE